MQRRQRELHYDLPHALTKRQHGQPPPHLGQRLRIAVQSHRPSSVAVSIRGGEHNQDCSYGDLNLASEGLSENLISAKAERGSTVALCCLPSVALMVAVVGILRAEAAYLPLLPSAEPAHKRSVLVSLGVRFIVTEESTLQSVQRDLEGLAVTIFLLSMGGRFIRSYASSSSITLSPPPVCSTLAYVICTSGTTGRPKTVSVPSESVFPNVLDFLRLWSPFNTDVWFAAAPITFDPSVIDFMCCFITGGRLLLVTEPQRSQPTALTTILVQEGASIMQCTPSLLRLFPEAELRSLADRSCLRILAFGGEVLRTSDVVPLTGEKWRRHLLRIFNLYGTTEMSVWASAHELSPLGLPSPPLPVGQPLSETVLKLQGEPREAPARVVIKSETRYTYVDGKRCSEQVTGDLGQWLEPDHVLAVLGRDDSLVKLHGKAVSLLDIERALISLHRVAAASVISCERADASLFLSAFVVLREPVAPAEETSLRAVLKHELRRAGSVVPSVVCFIDALPLSGSGKTDSARLRNRIATELAHQRELLITRAEIAAFLSLQWADLIVKQVDPSEPLSSTPRSLRFLQHVPDDSYFLIEGGSSLDALVLADRIATAVGHAGRRDLAQEIVQAVLTLPFAKLVNFIEGCARRTNAQTQEGVIKGGPDATALSSDEDYLSRVVSIRWSKDRMGFRSYDSGVVEPSIALPESPVLTHRWSRPMGECVDASPLLLSVLLSDHTNRTILIIGSHSQCVVALDASSGAVLWVCRLHGRVESTAAIYGRAQLVVVGCYDGGVYALSLRTGEIVGSFRTGGEVKATACIDEESGNAWIGSYDQHIYCIRLSDMTAMLRHDCRASILSSPQLHPTFGVIVVGCHSGAVFGFNAKTLSLLWTLEPAQPFTRSVLVTPLLLRDLAVLCSVSGEIAAVSVWTGKIAWQQRFNEPLTSSPCVLRDQLCVLSPTALLLLSQADGSLQCRHTLASPCNAIYLSAIPSQPIALCICSNSGNLQMLSVDKLEMIAHFQFTAEIFSSPVYAGGLIYVGCRDDRVHCVALVTRPAAAVT